MILDQNSVTLFAEHLKSRGKQPATIESYCRDASGFVNYLRNHRLTVDQIEPGTLLAYQDHLRADLTERENSVRRTVIGIRQYFRFLTDKSLVKASPFDSVAIPQRDDRLRRGLEIEVIARLLEAASQSQPSWKGTRDAAIIALLAYEGIKANEIIALRWSDLMTDLATAYLHIGGSRARSIRLGPESHRLLAAYQRQYHTLNHPVLSQAKEKLMFISFKGRDASCPLPNMTRHGLKFIVYELGDKVGTKSLNTEQLRHFAVTHLIAQGMAPDDIMAHLGLRRLGNIAKHLASVDHARLANLV
ncbi:MAG: hypothetical protein FJ146_01880 [Deltaproteobacteria bacterium]|nr:hypothetical protein [Deltaproteobacteria bacterium]